MSNGRPTREDFLGWIEKLFEPRPPREPMIVVSRECPDPRDVEDPADILPYITDVVL